MATVYEKLAELVSASFDVPVSDVRPAVTFGELEFDSLALVELGLAAQQEFGVPIDEADISSDKTVAEAVALIESRLAATG